MKYFILILTLLISGSVALAQQPQIPTLQVCNPTRVYGKGMVKIESRKDVRHNGTFYLYIPKRDPITCDPRTGYPRGKVIISRLSLSDSIEGDIISTYIEQVTTTGKHTPTVFIKGRCVVKGRKSVPGCRFWLMIADNHNARGKRPQDVVSFLVFDASGRRISYATAPLLEGNFWIQPTGY